MTERKDEPSPLAKRVLNAEGFVPGDSRPNQIGSARVTPESESLIDRVNKRVTDILYSNERYTDEADTTLRALLENEALETAMEEVDKEVRTGVKNYPDMDSYLRAMEPVTESTKINIDVAFPLKDNRDAIGEFFKNPGDYIHLAGVRMFVDGKMVERAGVLYLSDSRTLKFLPLPHFTGEGLIGDNNHRVNNTEELAKLGFVNKNEIDSTHPTGGKMVVGGMVKMAYANRASKAEERFGQSEGEHFGY